MLTPLLRSVRSFWKKFPMWVSIFGVTICISQTNSKHASRKELFWSLYKEIWSFRYLFLPSFQHP